MNRRIVALVIVCALIGSMALSVCAAPKIQLRWYLRWDNARLKNVAEPIKAEYEKLHPEVEIVIENISNSNEYFLKLQTMLAANSAPDVIYPATHQGYVLAANKQIIDLMPLAKKDKLDLKAYIPEVLELYKYNKKMLFGLPIDTAAIVIFYNKDMFDAAKVPYPTDDMTWEQFIEMGKKLVKDTDGDGKIDQFAFHFDTNTVWQVILYQKTGKLLFDDLYNPTKFLLTDKKQIEALQFCADMITKHKLTLTPAQRGTIGDMFMSGQAAMNIIGHWRVPTYNASVKFNWDVAALPQGGKIKANRGDGSCFAITKNSKHPQAAWEFVKYLAGPDAPGVKKLLALGQMVPAQTALTNHELYLRTPGQRIINKKAFLVGRENLMTVYQPFTTWYNEGENALRGALVPLWEGKATAEQVVKELAPQMEALMAGI